MAMPKTSVTQLYGSTLPLNKGIMFPKTIAVKVSFAISRKKPDNLSLFSFSFSLSSHWVMLMIFCKDNEFIEKLQIKTLFLDIFRINEMSKGIQRA